MEEDCGWANTCKLDVDAQWTKKEIHIDSMDESSKSGSIGLTEAEELVKYVATREPQYDKWQ